MSSAYDPESMSQAARLFAEIYDLEVTARDEILRGLRAESPDLAARVERMLELDAAQVGPLERARQQVAEAAESRFLSASSPPPPESLGPWKVLEPLGAGGMGEVFRAERSGDGFSQKAALKIVRPGMASEAVIERFRLERKVLARLEHPAIARLLDGGRAPDGRPWFAMELVEGMPITVYAQEHELGLEQRLRLLIDVADAVDFAHRSLVVHRDLKPSNILVSDSGGPKLLDFGLAKLLEDVSDPGLTRTEMRVLTPAYAAPEQILGEPITTATDVFALGVLLYELLTGELPNSRTTTSPAALAVMVSRETFERPSQRLRNQEQRAHESPQMFSARNARRLEGDLDTITLRALAAEPARRYGSAAAFADDLRRHLEGRPVAARPDTLSYRLGKFVMRHRAGALAAAVVVVSLLGGLGVSIQQTHLARRAAESSRLEAQRAERVKGFLISVFQQADPVENQGAEMPARQILAEGARRLESELEDEPSVRAELYDTVARIQSSLGLLDDGLANAERAVAERKRLFGESSVEHALSLATLGSVELAYGRLVEARQHIAEAIDLFEEAGDTSSAEYARALSGHGQILMMRGDLERALNEQTRAQAILASRLGAEAPESLEHLSNVAVIETELGHYETSIEIYRRVLRALEAHEGSTSARVLAVVLNLATSLDQAGHTAEALASFRRVVEGRRVVYGPNHPALGEALVIASIRLSRAGLGDEALAALAEARTIYEPLEHSELGSVDNYTGIVLADLGRYDEAATVLRRAVNRLEADLGPGDLVAVVARTNLAAALSESGRAEEAATLFEGAMQALDALGEFDNPRLLRSRLNWGSTLRRLGRLEEARVVLDSAAALAREQLGATHPRVGESLVELALLDLADGGPTAHENARAHLAAAESALGSQQPSPILARHLAALRAALDTRAADPELTAARKTSA